MREGWEYKKLGEVCNVINGLWTGKKEPFINVAVIRNTNFSKDCQLNLDNVAYIDVEAKQFASRKLLLGDIIIEKSGGSEKQPVGRPILFNISEGDYSFSNFTSTLRIKEDAKVESSFLHKCLYAFYLKGETLKLQSKTTGLHNLNMKGYLRQNIPLPPKSTQLAIVSELDKINELIRLKKEQLKNFDNLAQSIFYEMFGDPVENEMGWEVKKLGEFANFKNGLNFSKSTNGCLIRFLGVSDFQNRKQISSNELEHITLSESISEDYLLKTGDIVFVRSNGNKELIGRSVKLNITEPTTYSGFCIRCRIITDVIDKEFVAFILKTPAVHQLMTNSGRGCNISNLNQKNLNSIPIICPPYNLQHLFAQRIEQIEHQKAEVQKAIADLETLLASRMQYWFE